MKPPVGLAIVAIAIATNASAQAPAPYAGMQARAVKALSDEQVADLRAGRGMGLALAAELNGYPGPRHILELADSLALTGEQRAHVQQMFDAMTAEAIPLGTKLIDAEEKLDRLFADRSVTPASLEAATQTVGAVQASLRAAHLRYHLGTLKVLTPEQVRRYAELRGYGSTTPRHDHHRQ